MDAPNELLEPFEELRVVMKDLFIRRMARDGIWSETSLTMPQFRVLSLIAGQPEGRSGRELATLMGIAPSSITPLVDRLVEQGFADRQEDTQDRRITRIRATLAGRALMARGLEAQREDITNILNAVDPADRPRVAEGLRALSAAARGVLDHDVAVRQLVGVRA